MTLSLSELGLGCWSFGTDRYWGEQPHKDTVKTIQAALRGGITHFDTAQVYAAGRSEQVTGQQLKRVRKKVTIATKSFYHPPDAFKKGIDTSLRRLCTDYIDIFYLHWPARGKDFRPLMDILEQYRREGRIRAVGVSNFSLTEIKALMNYGTLDYLQTGHSLIYRQAEKEVVPFCQRNGIKIITYSSLAQGILTDKFMTRGGFDAGDPRRKLIFFDKEAEKHIYKFLEEMKQISRSLGLTMAQLALGWELSLPWTACVLAGARNRKQIEENIKFPTQGSNKALSRVILEKLSILSAPLDQYLPEGDNIFNHQPG